MKNKKRLFAVILTVCMCISLAACGAGSSMTAGDAETDDYNWKGETEAPGALYDSAVSESVTNTGAADKQTSSAIYQSSDVKLIRRAWLTVQTVEFDQSVAALEELVIELNGYYENAQLHSGSYYNRDGNRSGEYTIRIPASGYDQFMSQIGGIGHLTRRNESSEDVGEVYYDTEARLATQRTKQERLLALLKKTQSMEDIIALESALSDVEYQIERYSSDLKRYDSLIGYSTINITIDEVIRIVDEPGQRESLFARMKAGVVSSADGLVDGVQNVLVWLSYNLFGLLVTAGVLGGGGALVYGRIKNRKMTKQKPVDEEQPTE